LAKAKRWVITTSGDRPLSDIAKELEGAGLKGAEVLKEIGTITGSAEETALRKIRKVRGVEDVSPDAGVDIGPPGEEETW
jgi:hypothetical protein